MVGATVRISCCSCSLVILAVTILNNIYVCLVSYIYIPYVVNKLIMLYYSDHPSCEHNIIILLVKVLFRSPTTYTSPCYFHLWPLLFIQNLYLFSEHISAHVWFVKEMCLHMPSAFKILLAIFPHSKICIIMYISITPCNNPP